MPGWLKNAIFYEIYPQSFMDSNGDGIGDLQGIIEKLSYIKELGFNALWINPIYDSPFKDAGYDVRDYKKVAARYGTGDDARALFQKAHDMGIHVLLDLVPGHTSEEHEWFKKSCEIDRNEYSDRYVWTDSVWKGIADHPYISGEAERDGVYMLNFFKAQPALNYGFGDVKESWQMAPEDEGPRATVDAMIDVIRFWLDMGCDGFRVDMADSLVKSDDDVKSHTSKIWAGVFDVIRRDYPEAAFVAEWSNPTSALSLAHFDMDFYLDHHYNGYNTLVRDYETEGGDHSFFKRRAGGDIKRFLDDYLPKYEKTRGDGYISFISCNHDTPRPSRNLRADELKLFYAFLFTMPGVPFMYYGDEIGMRYIDSLRTKEGGYQRTGTRTPMQWNRDVNMGFSTASSDRLYLPLDPSSDAPCVSDAMADTDSLYYTVKDMISLRLEYEDLQADAPFEVLYGEKESFPFVYKRGDIVIAINPSGDEASCDIRPDDAKRLDSMECLYHIGEFEVGESDGDSNKLTMGAGAFVMFK